MSNGFFAKLIDVKTLSARVRGVDKGMVFGMSVVEQSIFFKKFSLLLTAGVSPAQGLKILTGQDGRRHHFAILTKILQNLEQGKSLSVSMREFPGFFSEFAVTAVEVGEVSGNLAENLHLMSDELMKGFHLRRKLKSAFIYPAFVILAGLILVTSLSGYVFPKVLPIFLGLNLDLPWVTRFLLAFGKFVSAFWLWLLFVGVFLAFFVLFAWRIDKVRKRVDRFMLAVPIFGRVLKSYFLASIARNLSVLLRGGLSVVKAVELTAKTIGSPSYQKVLWVVNLEVLKGKSLSVSLRGFPDLFSDNFIQMISIGESSGSLNKNLAFLSEFYEEEVMTFVGRFLVLLEPILLVLMGILVGFVAVGIVTPIYDITKNIHP